MSLILITGCPNHKIRHELRAFRRSEVTLSFELERVLDRNIGIGSPEAALGLSVIDVDACEAIFLKAGQPFTDSLTGWYQGSSCHPDQQRSSCQLVRQKH